MLMHLLLCPDAAGAAGVDLHAATRRAPRLQPGCNTISLSSLLMLCVSCAAQTPQAQQASTFTLPQDGGVDDLTAMMSQLDQRIAGPHRQVPTRYPLLADHCFDVHPPGGGV